MAKTYLRTGRISWSPLTSSQQTMLAAVSGTTVGQTFSATLDAPTEAFLISAGVISAPSSTVVATPGDTPGTVPIDNGDGTYSWGAASGGSGSMLTPTAVKTSNYTASAGDFVPVDASGGAVTITLPTAPADKSRVGIKIIAQAATPNTVTIARGGTDVFNKTGGSTSLSILPLFQAITLQYASSTGIWYATSTDYQLPSSVENAVTRVTQSALPTSPLMQTMASATVMSSPPTIGTRATGLTTATEVANSGISGSTRTSPNYASPRADTLYRIGGPFTYLNGNSGLDVGAAQSTRPGSIVGPTGMVGSYAFEFVGRYFEIWQRDSGGAQYFTMWVSQNGGAFQAHTNPDTMQTQATTGDGLYWLQPIDMGAHATWRIIIEGEALTFGGIRYAAARTDAGATATNGSSTVTDASITAKDAGRAVSGTNIPVGTYVGTVTAGTSFTLVDAYGNAVTTTGAVSGITLAADTLRYPSWASQRLLVFSDSYGVEGGTANLYRSCAGYANKLARSLGMELHLTGYGGTGWSAANGNAQSYYNFAGRIPAEVSPYFSASDQPAVVFLQGSINDGLGGFAGTAQFNTDAANLIQQVQTLYPSALIVAGHPMHPDRGNASMNTNDATIGGQIDTAMSNAGLPVPYDAVSSIPLTGTGTIAAPNGTGNSDQYSASDALHPTPAGSLALANGISSYITGLMVTASRTYTGTPNVPNGPLVTSALTTAQSASTAAIAASAPYEILADLGYADLSSLSTATNYILQPGAPGSAVTAATAGSAHGCVYINPPWMQVTGRTLYLRMRAHMFGNATAPGCAFTLTLYSRGSFSGSGSPSVAIGSATTPSVTLTITPSGANSVTQSSSGDVAISTLTAGWYLVVLTCSQNMTAGATMAVRTVLEFHNT